MLDQAQRINKDQLILNNKLPKGFIRCICIGRIPKDLSKLTIFEQIAISKYITCMTFMKLHAAHNANNEALYGYCISMATNMDDLFDSTIIKLLRTNISRYMNIMFINDEGVWNKALTKKKSMFKINAQNCIKWLKYLKKVNPGYRYYFLCDL